MTQTVLSRQMKINEYSMINDLTPSFYRDNMSLCHQIII